ncbi:MAG: hypothetical protein KW806_01155, partial [Candidatus Yanofskybacteria bacterium]|nr:hypothetical protein [Candidatus Yanofskybacteria bacterium]
DVIEEAIPLCKETIQKVIENIQPFALKIKKPIYAPPHKPTSMIWQTFKEEGEFTHLASEMFQAFQTLAEENPNAFPGLEESISHKIFPHITLARFKNWIPPQKLVPLGKTGLERSMLTVNSTQLIESKLTAEGSIFKVLEEFPLEP